MKRILASVLTCLVIVLVSLTVSGDAVAGQLIPASIRNFFVTSAVAQSDQDVMAQLQAEVMPQLEAILSPEQAEIFEAEISSGTSFRKTFQIAHADARTKSSAQVTAQIAAQKRYLCLTDADAKEEAFLRKKRSIYAFFR